MKQLGIICIALTLAFAGMGCEGEAYVTAQPEEVVYTRPASPGDGYVWIEGDWYWYGGRYVHREGHWARPRQGRTWVKGHWNHSQRGYHWQKGHWDRH
ncbi:MAG TPA: YXWGXW repeat-containing protein [Chitinophagaceae bacterium]|nr:YXWGXW repeat-containing protein [Chitinophagaceae bacterium]